MFLQLCAVEGGERAYATVRCHVGRGHEVGNVAVIKVCGEEMLCRRLVLPRGQVGQAVCAIQPRQDGDIVLLPLDAGTCIDEGFYFKSKKARKAGRDRETTYFQKSLAC